MARANFRLDIIVGRVPAAPTVVIALSTNLISRGLLGSSALPANIHGIVVRSTSSALAIVPRSCQPQEGITSFRLRYGEEMTTMQTS